MPQKKLDKRSYVGLGFHFSSWKGKDFGLDEDHDYYGDKYVNYNYSIVPSLGYFLNGESKIFNPGGILCIGLTNTHLENETKQLKDGIIDLQFIFGVLNRVKVSSKLGFTFGFMGITSSHFSWSENGELYSDHLHLNYQPFLTFDITNPFSNIF